MSKLIDINPYEDTVHALQKIQTNITLLNQFISKAENSFVTKEKELEDVFRDRYVIPPHIWIPVNAKYVRRAFTTRFWAPADFPSGVKSSYNPCLWTFCIYRKGDYGTIITPFTTFGNTIDNLRIGEIDLFNNVLSKTDSVNHIKVEKDPTHPLNLIFTWDISEDSEVRWSPSGGYTSDMRFTVEWRHSENSEWIKIAEVGATLYFIDTLTLNEA